MLPVELIEQIVEHLAGDTASLAACTLAGRALLGPVRSLLFRTIHLSCPTGSTRLQRLLTESPDLISLVTCLELSADATKSDEIEPLISSFCGPPDTDGRYHGAGPLRTVVLTKFPGYSFNPPPLRRAILSCSSITTITLHSVHNFFLSSYFPYISPNVRNLNLYNNGLINCKIFSPEVDIPSTLIKAICPAQITSVDLKGGRFISKSLPPLDLSYVNSIRILVEPESWHWLFNTSMFKRVTTPLPLHTLSIIFSPFTQSYDFPKHCLEPGFDSLSIFPFGKLRTLKIYASLGKSLVPYSFYWWLAGTLDKLPKRECHLKTLLVYIHISEGSQVHSFASSEEDQANLVKALRSAELTTVDFIVKLESRDVQATYDEFERHCLH